ncbi:Rubrerythrin [Candidatus Syntrophocurvum alkaliphilum]|uniref:Rubrerythrin n=1 Tax=Candidatus Syntrophocurvum alkaliphilum TaxID=2293317 RepID=A0A6I6DG61_9FIRM|nr:rubrerythrin family protein [Candidatus Syntrophocurvum alkaliphilum]QGU00018.1 Rubrerythrin [Candidatus Syntrophocurvum alkaliphilum]
MKSLKGTKTAENLMKAFAGESQARNRYTYYAAIADKEGYKQIRNIFIETADNEKEHAKRFYKFLLQGFEGELPTTIEIKDSFPAAQGTTLDNLKAAASGENEEWTDLYPVFADVAEEEGFQDIAVAFRMIASAEKSHEIRFNKLAENIEQNKVFKKDEKVQWKCGNCGYVHEGEGAPEKCPACIHPTSHFELFVETY